MVLNDKGIAMRGFIKVLAPAIVFCILQIGCSSESKLVEGPFVIKDGITFMQSTDTPVTGTIKAYHANGQLMDRYFYKKGFREGLFESFHTNGQLRVRGFYTDGVKNGRQEMFNDRGTLIAQVTYKSGIRDGGYISYDTDGKIELMGRYVNGQKNGPVEGFMSTGEKGFTGNYLNDLAQGKHSVYELDGQTRASWFCDRGLIVDKSLKNYTDLKFSPVRMESFRFKPCEEILSHWWHSPFEELGIGL